MRALLLVLSALTLSCAELTADEEAKIEKEFRDDRMQALISGIGKEDTPKEAKLKKAPIKADVPYLQCSVCKLMAAKAHERIAAVHAHGLANPPRKSKRQFDSSEQEHESKQRVAIDGVVARLCDAENRTTGSWMNEYDIVQRGSALELKHIGEGHCKRECRTIEQACWEVLEQVDDEIGDAVWKVVAEKKSSGDSQFQICNRVTDVCKKRNIPLLEGMRATDFPRA